MVDISIGSKMGKWKEGDREKCVACGWKGEDRGETERRGRGKCGRGREEERKAERKRIDKKQGGRYLVCEDSTNLSK